MRTAYWRDGRPRRCSRHRASAMCRPGSIRTGTTQGAAARLYRNTPRPHYFLRCLIRPRHRVYALALHTRRARPNVYAGELVGVLLVSCWPDRLGFNTPPLTSLPALPGGGCPKLHFVASDPRHPFSSYPYIILLYTTYVKEIRVRIWVPTGTDAPLGSSRHPLHRSRSRPRLRHYPRQPARRAPTTPRPVW